MGMNQDDIEFAVPSDTEIVVTEGACDLTISEEPQDTFLVPSENNVFVVKRWS